MNKVRSLLEKTVTPEIIDAYASIECLYFGDVILQAMGYNAVCIMFCKCRTGGYNLGWGLEDGKEYAKTFQTEEILKAFEGKLLKLDISVTRRE